MKTALSQYSRCLKDVTPLLTSECVAILTSVGFTVVDNWVELFLDNTIWKQIQQMKAVMDGLERRPAAVQPSQRTENRKQQETRDTSGVTSCFYDEKEFIYKTDSL